MKNQKPRYRQKGTNIHCGYLSLSRIGAILLIATRNKLGEIRKISAILLVIVIIFSLAACSKTNVNSILDEPEINQPQLHKTTSGQESEQIAPAAAPEEITEEIEQEKPSVEEGTEYTPTEANGNEENVLSASAQGETQRSLRPEFKEAMDSYEAFYDEYCDFMMQYKENPSDLKLLAGYYDMLIKLSEMEESFEAWEDEDLSKEELAYYVEVTNRVAQKLLEIT